MTPKKERPMRLATSAVVAGATLALLPAGAHAKELASARACDSDGCRKITDRPTPRAMAEGQPASAPEHGAPFYRVRMTVKVERDEQFRYAVAYVPSAGLLRVRGEFGGYDWTAPPPRALRGFVQLTHGLEPLPARELTGVGVEQTEASVDGIVPAPVPREDGLPWTLLLIPGGLALAAATWRVTKPHVRRAAGHGPLARDDAS
jgi:hypothetical protein